MRLTAALALVARALRSDARSLRIGLLRTTVIAILILALGVSVSSASMFGAPGLRLLAWLLYTNFFLVTFVAVTMFPTIIVEEKELKTLDLLRLAGLNPIAILLAKSAGVLTSALLLLAVQLPFAMLAVMMGGVSSHQVLTGFAILSAYGLFLLAVAVVCSVMSPNAARAMRLTTGVVACLLIGLPLVELVASSGSSAKTLIAWLNHLSAWEGLGRVIATGHTEPIWNEAVRAHLTAAASLGVLAWLLFERVARHETVTMTPSRWLDAMLGEPRRGRPRSGKDAFAWKDFHFLEGGVRGLRTRWCFYGMLWALVGIAAWDAGPGGWHAAAVCAQTMWGVMLVAVVLESLFLAGRVLQEEVRLGTLAGLMAAPVVVQDWIDAKFSGALRILSPALWSLVLGSILPLFLSRGDEMFALFLMTSWLIMLYVGANVWLAAHLTAYLSLFMQRGAAATVVAIFTVGHFLLGLLLFTAREPCLVLVAPFVTTWAAFPLTRLLRRKVRDRLKEVAGA